MPSIVYQTRKGHRYAYSSESYWDKEKKAPRAKLTYLGPVDEETGEIIMNYREKKRQEKETRKQGEEETAQTLAELHRTIAAQTERIAGLERQLKELQHKCDQYERDFSKIAAIVVH